MQSLKNSQDQQDRKDQDQKSDQPEWVKKHFRLIDVFSGYADVLKKLDWFIFLIFAAIILFAATIMLFSYGLKSETTTFISLAHILITTLLLKKNIFKKPEN